MAGLCAPSGPVTIKIASGISRRSAASVRNAHRDDLPLVPSLRSMLEQEEYNHRTVFSVVPDGFDLDDLIRRTEELVGDFEAEHTGLIFVVPVLQVRGLRRSTSA